MLKTIVLIAIAMLAGCATPRGNVITEGNANFVAINWADSPTWGRDTLQLAEQHCAKYGKTAQFDKNINDFTKSYLCVK